MIFDAMEEKGDVPLAKVGKFSPAYSFSMSGKILAKVNQYNTSLKCGTILVVWFKIRVNGRF